MKAVEIATKNHVSSDDIIGVCKELGIPYSNPETEFSDNDVFLVEKKIETIKKIKAQETLQLLAKKNKKEPSGKKIKLKRKVRIPTKEQPIQTTFTNKTIKQKENKEKETPIIHDKKVETKKVETKKPDKKINKFDTKPSKPSSKDSSTKKKKTKEKDYKKKQKYKTDEKYYSNKKPRQLLEKVENKKEEPLPPKQITITETISVGNLSKKLNVKAKDVISKLMKLGMMATINEIIDAETAEILAAEYNTDIKIISLFDETIIKLNEEDKLEDRKTRPPIVTVMGHVDHGKTKLLDSIRKSNIVYKEFGGITQHIGAYKVTIRDNKISFIDTPGHEAFTAMRARGAKVTDIVILVIAVNDGVMPQTIEAINHAKDANVPTIVALNKIDLSGANPQKIKQELSKFDLNPEEWGGSTLFCEISAKHNTNINELLELILVQAEILELKYNPNIKAKGTVIESRLDTGKGPIATIMIQDGILKTGSSFVVGIQSGKIRAMFDDHGRQIDEAPASTPVEILGISDVPSAGDPFQVVESEKYAKQVAQKRKDLKKHELGKTVKRVTLEDLNELIKEGEIKELRIIIKSDVDGSSQTLRESLLKLSTGEVKVKIVHAGSGGINESDVMLASASNSILLGYNVRASSKVSETAQREGVTIQYYNIIFDAIDAIKSSLIGMHAPEIKEKVVASGEVKEIFKISQIGTIAGSILQSGKLNKKNKIRLIRDNIVIYDDEIKTLRRFKNDVNEIEINQEFGFTLTSYNDIKVGDTFEAYTMIEEMKNIQL